MEHEHNFYGVNFAPFPHRGVLSSENAHRSMATMVEATAANWVILSPSGIQSDPYSEEINWNTNATPTDEELCSAIRFAKQLGVQVANWRASFGVFVSFTASLGQPSLLPTPFMMTRTSGFFVIICILQSQEISVF